jgi:REP element-mobilizing transposase RayT
MRQPRLKIPSSESAARYHAMSRAVNGEFYFRRAADKEAFCQIMWRVADFCGVQVLTFVVMSNHFHIELHIPLFGPVSDEELLRRYEILHPKPTWRNGARIEEIREMLRENGPEAEAWRKRQLRLMGDLSQFMKLLKQRFSIRYNRTHNRFGTLWAERYKSVMMEGQDREEASICTSLYIDLNPVRAGIVKDPKDYRFCGYGAAVGGDERARRGIMILTESATWEEAQPKYRQMLFAAAAEARRKGATISAEESEEIRRAKCRLPFSAVLLCRARYLTNTLVLGSQLFVERHLAHYRQRTGARMRAGPRPLPPAWGEIFALRAPKQSS